MKDVARAAGVSQAAVSYAYSSSPKVSVSQREHIYETARAIGYSGPNIVGSSLRSGKVGAVGVMVMDSLVYALEDPSTTLLMKGIAEVNELADVALTLLPLVSTRSEQFNSPAVRGLVDGVVLHNVANEHPIISTLLESGVPTVAIDSPRIAGIPYVAIDDRAAGRDQMEHVLSLGHRKIGVIADRLTIRGVSGPVTVADVRSGTERVVRERMLGYFDACEARGIAPDTVTMVQSGGIDRGHGIASARELLDATRVTAIVATSDVHAAAALSVLRERDLAVPQSVSVIGFDDAPIAELLDLSTIRQPLVDKGRAAASILLDRIDGGKRRRSILRTELVVRRTTGPAPR